MPYYLKDMQEIMPYNDGTNFIRASLRNNSLTIGNSYKFSFSWGRHQRGRVKNGSTNKKGVEMLSTEEMLVTQGI